MSFVSGVCLLTVLLFQTPYGRHLQPAVLATSGKYFFSLVRLGTFSPFLYGRQLLYLPVYFATHQSPFEKGSTPKKKEFAPLKGSALPGKNFFPVRVTFFTDGRQNNLDKSCLP